MNRISELLHDKAYLFKSPGIATLLMHKQKASNFFQLINCNDDENTHKLIELQVKLKKKS